MTPAVHPAVAAARAALGTPFLHQGRTAGWGLDCAGVLVLAARSMGHTPDEPPAYARMPHDGLLESWVDRQPFLVRIERAAMRAGDLLLMRFAAEPQHLALYADPTIIHAYQGVGRVVEHRLDDKWRRRIVRVYRFVPLAGGES